MVGKLDSQFVKERPYSVFFNSLTVFNQSNQSFKYQRLNSAHFTVFQLNEKAEYTILLALCYQQYLLSVTRSMPNTDMNSKII